MFFRILKMSLKMFWGFTTFYNFEVSLKLIEKISPPRRFLGIEF